MNSGNTLAARTGTSLRDLMTRMGHDNPRAALIYQHASAEADLATAAAINAMVEAATSARKPSLRNRPRRAHMATPRMTIKAGPGFWATRANGTAMARMPLSDGDGRSLHRGAGARFACSATLFACGAGDGNRTRTVSLGRVLIPPCFRVLQRYWRPQLASGDLAGLVLWPVCGPVLSLRAWLRPTRAGRSRSGWERRRASRPHARSDTAEAGQRLMPGRGDGAGRR